MSETVRSGQGTETPVNPYSLLEAVNNSSDTAHTAWVLFLALMAYLMIAVAGVTHKDLLLETPVALPLLQVSIQQAQFFQFAAILLVLLHLGVVAQLVLLARKTLEFDQAVRSLEATDLRTHPLRLELHNFFFVQAVAGPHRSYVMSAFLHGMSWLTLVVVPVILLLFIQIRYLPFHDAAVTWSHRIALVADIGMLVLIGIFLTRAEASFPRALWHTTKEHPLTFVGTAGLMAAVTFFSFFVATIPGEWLDRLSAPMSWATGNQPVAQPSSRIASQAAPKAQGFSLPFASARSDGSLFGLFHRNIVATDADLVLSKDGRPGEGGIALRNRDLRFAKLDRTDFRGADLTNSDLDGASFVGADLTNVKMQCADINELYLSDNREAARCVSARGTNFTRAKMKDARLAGIDARGARFEEAGLEAADLTYALLSGANFSSAHLERADFSGGTQLQGANFLIASMQGADLSGAILFLADFSSAQMQGVVLSHSEMQGANFLIASMQGADLSGAILFLADFSSAQMQGVVLSHSEMQGALLRDADLEGADLGHTKLQGADFTRARLRAADLRGAAIWKTLVPADDMLQLADFSELLIRPLDATETARIGTMIDKIDQAALKSQMRDGLGAVINLSDAQKWATTADAQKWQALLVTAGAVTADAYKGQITEFLGRLMCKARWSNGAVATGVAKRALGQAFRGDIAVIYDRLKTKECAASETVARKSFRDLASQVDIVRGN